MDCWGLSGQPRTNLCALSSMVCAVYESNARTHYMNVIHIISNQMVINDKNGEHTPEINFPTLKCT